MRIAITGTNGFVGTALLRAIAATSNEPISLTRDVLADPERTAGALQGADAVIHLAGLAHRTGADTPDAAAYMSANRDLPARLYEAARAAGVPRFIHVSTIAVLSGHTGVLTTDLPLRPTTPYDASKAAAETTLRDLAAGGGPALAIIRPPLVYGPGAKANLRSLLKLCASPLPLPFGTVANRRSMVGVSNLADALLFLATLPGPLPSSAIFHVSDGADLSLADLIRHIRAGMGRSAGLFGVPPALLRTALVATGRRRMASQLLDDQVVDASALRSLGWTPPYGPEVDLRAMAEAFQRGAS